MASLLSTEDAATLKECSRNTVVRAVNAGIINGQQVGRAWVIFDDDALKKWEPDRKMQRVVARSRGHPSELMKIVFLQHIEVFVKALANKYNVHPSDITITFPDKKGIDFVCSIPSKELFHDRIHVAFTVFFTQSAATDSFPKSAFKNIEALKDDPDLKHINYYCAVIPGDKDPILSSLFSPFSEHFAFDHRRVLREAVGCKNPNHDHARITRNAQLDYVAKDRGWIWSHRHRLYHPICHMDAPFPGFDQGIDYDLPINQCFRYLRSNPGEVTGTYLSWAEKEGMRRPMHDLIYRSDHIVSLQKTPKGRTMQIEVLWPK